jgi:RHS repeat-associated protein
VNAAVSIFLTLLIFLAGGSFAAGMASTEANSPAVLTSSIYDKAHNRTSRAIAGVTTASVFGNGNNGANSNQLISYGAGTQPSVSFSYDANGNRATRTTAAGKENYTWDFEQCARKGSILDGGETIARRVNDAMPRIMNQNRLTQLTKPGVGTYQYQYDFRSRRVTRDESQASGLKTLLTFSGGSSVQEASAAGVLITELIRGSDWGGGVGGILYSIRSGARSYNGYNSRGDVVSTTSDSGSANWQASYEAFGKRTAEQGTNVERQRGNTKDEDPTGLLNEGHRYRDLETGEFISRDPLGFIDGPNVYAYTMQNPWSGFDPEGLSAWSDFKGYWKGVGNGAGGMATGMATMAWDAHPVVNGGQYLMGQQTGYQRSFEGGVAMAKAAQNLATSSQARSGAFGAVGNHLNEAWNNPEKAGELAFNAVTTAVTLGEAGVAIASKVKAGASLAASARVTAGAAEAEVAISEAAGGITGAAKNTVRHLNGLEFKAVRDLGHIDDATLNAMQKHGFAAKTKNGDPIVLHHHQQNPAGPIVEMPAPNHSIGNPKQHPFGNQKGMGLAPEQRDAFNKTRVDYWKQRATDELNQR